MNKYLYNAPNRLFLIINNDEYQIREPVGWGDATFSIKRNDHHGFDFKFPNSDIQLKFHNRKAVDDYQEAKTLIDAALNTYGADVTLKLRLEYYTGGVWVLMDEIELDTEAYVNDEYDSILKTSTSTYEKQIENILTTKVNLFSDEDYEGNAITQFVPDDVWYHSKILRKQFSAEHEGTSYDLSPPGLIGGVNDLFFTIGWSKITNDEIETHNNILSGFQSSIPTSEGLSVFSIKESGEFSLSLDSIPFSYSFPTSAGITSYQLVMNLRVAVYDISGNQIDFSSIWSASQSGSPSGGEVIFFQETASGTYTYDANLGDEIYVFFQLSTETNPSNISVSTSFSLFSAIIDSSFSATQDTEIPGSNRKSYGLLPTLQKIEEILTGSTTLQSDFFTNTYPNLYLTSGSILKGGTLGKSTAPVITLQSALKSIDAIFNTGWNFEGNNIRLEESEHFYNRSNQIIDLTTRDIYNLKETTAKEYIFNEAEFGYPDLRYDELNTIDEFNTRAEYLLSSRKIKNKYSKISDWKTQGYDIEFLRRQALKTDSTAFEEDKDIYLVACHDISEEITASFFDSSSDFIAIPTSFYRKARSQKSITITGTVSNNKTFTWNSDDDVTEGSTTTNIVVNQTAIDEFSVTCTATLAYIPTESNADFVTLTDVISPETAYNAKLSPARNKMRHDVWLNASQHYKEYTDTTINTNYEYNGDMVSRLRVADSYYDPDRLFLTQAQNFRLAASNQFKHWVIPVKSEFSCELSFDEYMSIKDACQGGTNAYGYITHLNWKGETVDSWLLDLEGNPNDNNFKIITLWWRVNGEGPPPPPDFWTDENLDNILQTAGGNTISWT